MKDYREKVRKLLALAESPNEFEAKAALLKAKELMAEHKLTAEELEDHKKRDVKDLRTGYTYTMRGEWWLGSLAVIIAENYCCKCVNLKANGAQKREIKFIGLDEDVDLCFAVFEYAVKSVRGLIKQHCKPLRKKYTNADVKIAGQSFGYGFVDGVKRAFEEQKKQKEEGWGLVMIIPQEVNDYYDGLSVRRMRSSARTINNESNAAGYNEGKKFNPRRCIA